MYRLIDINNLDEGDIARVLKMPGVELRDGDIQLAINALHCQADDCQRFAEQPLQLPNVVLAMQESARAYITVQRKLEEA